MSWKPTAKSDALSSKTKALATIFLFNKFFVNGAKNQTSNKNFWIEIFMNCSNNAWFYLDHSISNLVFNQKCFKQTHILARKNVIHI